MKKFSDFEEGDFISFSNIYTKEDFEKFYNLSGDFNKLHHDKKYSLLTEYKEPIVPLHLSISPLSKIAGMYLPGQPSLYLGHEINALNPVFYEKEVNYFAKIISINKKYRILTIRVLIVQDLNICLVAKMRVKARYENWSDNENKKIINNINQKSFALITGSTGELGKCLSHKLAKNGFNLCLHTSNKDSDKFKELKNSLSHLKCEIKFFESNLAEPSGRALLKNNIEALGTNLSTIIHCASSPADSSLEKLLGTNYITLKDIVDTSKNLFLNRQDGRVVFVSSIYLVKPINDYDNYISVKSMCTSYLSRLNKLYSNYDLSFNSILPSVIDTPFSNSSQDTEKLIPEEVSEEIIKIIKNPKDEIVLKEVGGVKKGYYGFYNSEMHNPSENFVYSNEKENLKSDVQKNFVKQNDFNYAKLENIIRSILMLPEDYNIENSGYGITPSWDSLAQLQIIAEFESIYNLRLSSLQLEKANSYKELISIINSKNN